MTLEQFQTAVNTIKIPNYYGYMPENTSPPYIAYNATQKNVIHADGVVVYSENDIDFRFVSVERDLDTEADIEGMLSDNGIAFDAPELEFDEEQRIHIATYNFQI